MPSSTVSMTDHNTRKHRLFVRISALMVASFLLLLALLALAGCSSDTTTSDTSDTTATAGQLTLKEKDPVTEESVTKMVTRKVGETDYSGEPIIRNITLSPDGEGTFVDIGVGRPPSCHPGQVVGYITEMSRGFMSSLFLYPDVTKVQVSLYGTTDNTADRDILAARALMNKADADAIEDWFAYTESTASAMSTEFWVEPVIYANWQQFGSTTITDPALLEQANQ